MSTLSQEALEDRDMGGRPQAPEGPWDLASQERPQGQAPQVNQPHSPNLNRKCPLRSPR